MTSPFSVSYNNATGTANRVQLSPGETLIGRATNCHIVLNVASVSRQHARLRVAGDTCLLSDAGSTYGTQLNGATVRGEVQLKSGDTFQCGAVAFTLEQAIPAVQLLTDDDHQLLQNSSSIMLHIDDAALSQVHEP
jgi:pSer/pThr/pTyr-binding forkhead associated (FHA) protein